MTNAISGDLEFYIVKIGVIFGDFFLYFCLGVGYRNIFFRFPPERVYYLDLFVNR